MDTREEVDNSELARIENWDEDSKQKALRKVPSGWPDIVLSDLLHKDPARRPRNWDVVVDSLKNMKSQPKVQKLLTKSHPSMWSMSYEQLMAFDQKASQDFGSEYHKMTMRDINREILLPSCEEHGTSYALRLNPDGLMVDAFISHSWDEEFGPFVASIRKAFQTTVKKPNLWICAFALVQGDQKVIEKQLGTKDVPLTESPFVKALEDASTFVVVRNPTTDLYSRIWCVCELIFAFKLGLVPDRTHVTGPDVFSHLETSCKDAESFNPEDKEKILCVLVSEFNLQEIDKIVQIFRTQETPE